ncbi:MAG: hypothetical protein WC136_08940 [Sphaerochaeta sp.]
MQFNELTDSNKSEIINSFNQDGMNRALSTKFGVTTRTIRKWRSKLMKNPDPIIKEEKLNLLSDSNKTIARLTEENKYLKKVINDAQSEVIASDDIRRLIFELNDCEFTDTIPEWVDNVSKTNLVPVCCLSDIHVGETINSKDMGFGEDYNTQIAHDYSLKVINDFIGICKKNMTCYDFPGIVLILGGDGITGNLHDLSDTNDKTPIEQVVELVNLYIKVIGILNDNFENVCVLGVTGNHGRYDPKHYTKTKNRANNSLETIVYHFIQKHFNDNKSINIITDQSDELFFKINSRRFYLHHGDTIKGGNGIGGIHVPIMRSRAKKLGTSVANDKAFDTMIIGHFHQHYVSDELIIMNSIKPYDEYCKSFNFPYSRPGMTTFFVNNHGDIIYATDIKIRKKLNNKPTKHIELF